MRITKVERDYGFKEKGIQMEIRKTTNMDLKDILFVESQAFGDEGPVIVDLVEGLLNDPTAKPLLSLLAFKDVKAVGHILFTKAHIEKTKRSVSSVILAPLAVLPEEQSKGIGRQLIKEGLKILTESGVELVFVLGHPGYYPRSGFTPAGVLGLDAPYPIPKKDADAWMVQELKPGIIGTVKGQVKCADFMDKEMYWRE